MRQATGPGAQHHPQTSQGVFPPLCAAAFEGCQPCTTPRSGLAARTKCTHFTENTHLSSEQEHQQ